MTSPLVFTSVRVRSFRNLATLDFAPASRLNVIAGDNGQGKTSLLEALYVVATTKSFRAERVKDVIRDGDPQATVVAQLTEPGLGYEQRVALARTTKSYLLDGKKPDRLAAFAIRTPVVVFHPGDLDLVSGAASLRRTLLDRVALHAHPASGEDRAFYTRALRERQLVLDARGPQAAELDVYERLMADHGSRFTVARRAAAEALVAALQPAFTRMAATDVVLDVQYRPAGSEDPATFREALARLRGVDARRRRATFGPQRDELELTVNGRSARHHASQGQQRILALALKVAELTCVREARGAHPVLLLDDVSSELDPARTGAVYEFLRTTQSQVFVTTTRPELFATPALEAAERADWRLQAGALAP